LVAHLLWEQRVAGSNPASPTKIQNAGVAQSVEQLTCNEKVEGSIPFSGTTSYIANNLDLKYNDLHPTVAQGIEQQPSKLWVARSIRAGRANLHKEQK